MALVLRDGAGVRRVRAAEAGTRFRELVNGGRGEHLAMYTQMTFDDDVVQRALPSAWRRRSRGMRLRTMAPVGSAVPDLSPEDLAVLDGDHRRLVDPPTAMNIVDRRVALLPADPAQPGGDRLEVWEPALVAGLVALFEQHWALAAPAPLHEALSVRERAVVGMLAEGCTDAVVARRLGVSERTVTYTVRALLDRYDARSRFQLAIKVCR